MLLSPTKRDPIPLVPPAIPETEPPARNPALVFAKPVELSVSVNDALTGEVFVRISGEVICCPFLTFPRLTVCIETAAATVYATTLCVIERICGASAVGFNPGICAPFTVAVLPSSSRKEPVPALTRVTLRLVLSDPPAISAPIEPPTTVFDTAYSAADRSSL